MVSYTTGLRNSLFLLLDMEMVIVAVTEQPLAIRVLLFQNLGAPGNLTQ